MSALPERWIKNEDTLFKIDIAILFNHEYCSWFACIRGLSLMRQNAYFCQKRLPSPCWRTMGEFDLFGSSQGRSERRYSNPTAKKIINEVFPGGKTKGSPHSSRKKTTFFYRFNRISSRTRDTYENGWIKIFSSVPWRGRCRHLHRNRGLTLRGVPEGARNRPLSIRVGKNGGSAFLLFRDGDKVGVITAIYRQDYTGQ